MRISQIPHREPNLPQRCGQVRIITTQLFENAGPLEAGFLKTLIYSY
jgi:hypothetical protein